MNFSRKLAVVAGIAGAIYAAPGIAKEFALSTIMPPSHYQTRFMMAGWADLVRKETNGAVDIKVFSGGSLLPALGTLKGVQEGVAQVGHISATYNSSDFPHNYIAGELGFKNPNYYALAYAYVDYAMNDPIGHAEWKKYNVIPIGSVSTPLYHYLCRGVVTTVDQMKGLKVRTFGGGWGKFANDIGMVSVALPYNEVYSAMERGQVDCANLASSDLFGGALVAPLTKSVLKIPTAPGYSSIQLGLNGDFWRGLTKEQRRILLDASAISMGRALAAAEAEVVSNEKTGREKGIVFTAMTPQMTAFFNDWNGKYLNTVVEAAQKRGVNDAAGTIATMQKYIDKWATLLKSVDRNDADAIGKIGKVNLFDKIDVTKYGM